MSKVSGRVKKRFFLKAGSRNRTKEAAATVVFVPSTRFSLLLRSLRDEEDKMAVMTGFRVKYQEAGGSVLSNAFDKDLGRGQNCGRVPCPPCEKPEKRENCRSRNVVYESKCKICNPVSIQEEDTDQQSGRGTTPREGI